MGAGYIRASLSPNDLITPLRAAQSRNAKVQYARNHYQALPTFIITTNEPKPPIAAHGHRNASLQSKTSQRNGTSHIHLLRNLLANATYQTATSAKLSGLAPEASPSAAHVAVRAAGLHALYSVQLVLFGRQ
jgi:hypothetical protein